MAVTSSNRRQVSAVLETTLGTTPGSPRMRQKLITGESLKYTPTYTDSNEIRSDRMTSDSIVVGLDSSGAVNWEFHYPYPDSCADFDIRSAFYNNFTLTPTRDNDGVADSVITDIGTIANTLTCTTGTAFVIGHLVRTTGFATAANNTIAKVTTGGATSYVATAGGYVGEAVPPAAARAKVVGFQGISGEISATSTGLAASTLNLTTLGLAVGQWIKIGGTAAGDRFTNVPANNGRARITAISATNLTLDSLPTGWGIDNGTGKTIKVWYGDRIVNGTTQISQTIERGDLGMTTPVYIAQPGMVASQWSISVRPKAIITGSTTYMGMGGGAQSTTTLDAVIDAAPSQSLYPQFAGSANVGRILEAGVPLAAPNYCIGFDMTIVNNVLGAESIDAVGPQDMVPGECGASGTFNTLYGDNTLLTKFFNGTPTSLAVALTKGAQLVLINVPRAMYVSDGSPNAGGKNQLINASFGWRASKDDALTNVEISMDRLEYVET